MELMKDASVLVIAHKLSKSFNDQKAVDEIDFEIHSGEVVGFLGPNGAGKTTTIRMLLNLLSPTSGTLNLFGLTYERNRADILRLMNSSSGSLTLPGKLSVMENLKVFADLYGIKAAKKRIAYLIEKFDLESLQNRNLYSLSTGQQVRVSLAKAFINSPKLLLLDEPTASLDPDVADQVRSFLMKVVKEEGTTIFLTSHNMNEVAKICSRILFLNKGKIQVEGTPRELAHRVKQWKVILKTKTQNLTLEMDQAQVGPYLTQLAREGTDIETISIHEPTLEDFFVQSAREGTDK